MIRYGMNNIKAFFFGSLACIMMITTGFLIGEYCFFKKQAAQMCAVKQDYQNHLVAIKKVLAEYNYLKELFESRDNQDDEKKKINNDLENSCLLFKEGANIFFIDDDFFLDFFFFFIFYLEYLKQSSLDYLAHHNLAAQVQGDEWLDYHDYIKEQPTVVSSSVRKKKKPAQKRVVSGSSVSKKSVDSPPRPVKDIHCSWPIKRSDFWISSRFGPRKKINGAAGFHHGIDMAAVKGTPVMAAADGVVVEAGYNAHGYGYNVVLAHNRKYRTRYAHLDKICTRVGRTVSRGELIGRVGETGRVRKKGKDASHLHFELHAFGKKINPIYFLG